LKRDETDSKIFVAYGENEDFFCRNCTRTIERQGFLCEMNDQVMLCEECQDKYNMRNCRHDKIGEHKHLKFWRGI